MFNSNAATTTAIIPLILYKNQYDIIQFKGEVLNFNT